MQINHRVMHIGHKNRPVTQTIASYFFVIDFDKTSISGNNDLEQYTIPTLSMKIVDL